MAIIIPSKHIYSKSFDPVIDNNIDKIEAEEKVPQIINQKNTNVYTYNGDGSVWLKQEYDNQIAVGIGAVITPQEGGFVAGYITSKVAYAGYKEQGFFQKEILIPVVGVNRRIERLILGTTDYDGTNNISYSINGYINAGTVVSSGWECHFPTKPTSTSFTTPSITKYSTNFVYNKTDSNTRLVKYDIPKKTNTPATYQPPASSNLANKNIVAEVELIDNSNLSTVAASKKVVDGKEYYKLQLKILTHIKVLHLQGDPYVSSTWTGEGDAVFDMSGTYEEYIPQTISISVNGDTIELNLDDNTITIGDGKSVFSFDSNELIQTKNTPSIESKYQGVVDKWKNGKQTAVITCPIADHYDEDGNLATSLYEKYRYDNPITIKKVTKVFDSDGNTTYRIEEIGTEKIQTGYRLYYADTSAIVYSNYQKNIWAIGVKTNSEFADMLDGNTEFTVNLRSAPIHIPMTFREGNIVIPYTYTNKGDKPLSYNKDFTPKQFKVVGVGISKKQGGTQELTLQEV